MIELEQTIGGVGSSLSLKVTVFAGSPVLNVGSRSETLTMISLASLTACNFLPALLEYSDATQGLPFEKVTSMLLMSCPSTATARLYAFIVSSALFKSLASIHTSPHQFWETDTGEGAVGAAVVGLGVGIITEF